MKRINWLFLGYIVVALITISCNENYNNFAVDSSKLKIEEVNIHRYGKQLFDIDTNNFINEVRGIKEEFVLFLGEDLDDTTKLAPLYEYVTDTTLIYIAASVNELYPDLSYLENELSIAFGRYDYFFPDFNSPVVYTYVSNLYYEKPIIYDDSVLVIGLDVYLGPNFKLYRSLGLPNYKIRRMTSDYISIDVMKSIYEKNLLKRNKQKTLVDKMIESGKLFYYLDAVLPYTPDSLKIGYTNKQMRWIEKNRKNVWAFLVNNNLFYSPDFKIQSDFLKEAPFTSSFSNESPPRIGQWLGWQIVRKYMKNHPDVSLSALIRNNDYQKIFNESGFKP